MIYNTRFRNRRRALAAVASSPSFPSPESPPPGVPLPTSSRRNIPASSCFRGDFSLVDLLVSSFASSSKFASCPAKTPKPVKLY